MIERERSRWYRGAKREVHPLESRYHSPSKSRIPTSRRCGIPCKLTGTTS
ncbi:hypothetical protein [Microseira wollei]|nr:hypothetical protein [Microseira wollei]